MTCLTARPWLGFPPFFLRACVLAQFPEKMIPKFTLLASRGADLPIHGDGLAVRRCASWPMGALPSGIQLGRHVFAQTSRMQVS